MTWDPLGTIGNARWIGGGQWAGKTTVAGILARRYGLTVYRHDCPASRSHLDRAAAAQARAGEPVTGFDPDRAFVQRNPQAMAAERNRVDRDRLIAGDAAQSAVGHGVPVIEVDGSRDADGVAGLAAGPLGLA